MITHAAASAHPSAQAPELVLSRAGAGKEKKFESHHYDGKPSADSGTNQWSSLPREQETSLTEQLPCVGDGDIKPSGPNLLGWELDMTLSTLWFFGLAEKIIT